MKKILASVLTAAMTMSLLTACGGGSGSQETTGSGNTGNAENSGNANTADTAADSGETGSQSGSEASDSGYQTTYGDKQFDNVTITVELFDRSNAPEGSTILDNKWTKYAQEQMKKVGINVEFVAVPRSDEITKMQTMMASGTAPDLTCTYTYSYAEDYYNDGGIWDLSEFVDGENQVKNLKAYLGEDVIDIGRGRGALYGIVARRATTAKSNLFIRQDWLEKLGMETPSTPDELYDYLEACVKNNPDGLSNVIGAYFWLLESNTTGTGYRNNMSMAFSQLNGDDKELAIAFGYDFYYDPGFREYVRFLNKCYNNGVMDQEFYTNTNETFIQKVVNSQYAFYESNVNYNVDPLRNSPETTLRENTPSAKFVSIPNLANVSDGKQYTSTYASGGLIIMCPKTASAEKVEAAMTYLDWMATTDGGYVLYHGFEGEHYELDKEGTPIVIDASYNAKDKDWIRTDMFLIGNQGYFATVDEFNKCTAAENPVYYDDVVANYENSLTGKTILTPTMTSTPEKQAELTDDFLLLRSKYLVQCITCTPDAMDAIYDEWLEEARKIGIDEVIAERKTYFDGVYGN